MIPQSTVKVLGQLLTALVLTWEGRLQVDGLPHLTEGHLVDYTVGLHMSDIAWYYMFITLDAIG